MGDCRARFQNSLLKVSRISNICHTGGLAVIQVFFPDSSKYWNIKGNDAKLNVQVSSPPLSEETLTDRGLLHILLPQKHPNWASTVILY